MPCSRATSSSRPRSSELRSRARVGVGRGHQAGHRLERHRGRGHAELRCRRGPAGRCARAPAGRAAPSRPCMSPSRASTVSTSCSRIAAPWLTICRAAGEPRRSARRGGPARRGRACSGARARSRRASLAEGAVEVLGEAGAAAVHHGVRHLVGQHLLVGAGGGVGAGVRAAVVAAVVRARPASCRSAPASSGTAARARTPARRCRSACRRPSRCGRRRAARCPATGRAPVGSIVTASPRWRCGHLVLHLDRLARQLEAALRVHHVDHRVADVDVRALEEALVELGAGGGLDRAAGGAWRRRGCRRSA